MLFAAFLACATPTSLEGSWTVQELEFDSVTAEDAFGRDWSGTATIQGGGAGRLEVAGSSYEMAMTLSAEDLGGGTWHLSGKADGMRILDLSCELDAAGASCLESGEVDWSREDSDAYVVLLTMSPA